MLSHDSHFEQFKQYYWDIFMVDGQKAFVAAALLLSNTVMLVTLAASQALYIKINGQS